MGSPPLSIPVPTKCFPFQKWRSPTKWFAWLSASRYIVPAQSSGESLTITNRVCLCLRLHHWFFLLIIVPCKLLNEKDDVVVDLQFIESKIHHRQSLFSFWVILKKCRKEHSLVHLCLKNAQIYILLCKKAKKLFLIRGGKRKWEEARGSERR